MGTYIDSKFKDEVPVNTVNRIKNKLNSVGIFTIEMGWKNLSNKFYSVSVVIKDTNLSTNGKGTTPEYALASAYGELMERLQNQSFFKLSIDVSPKALKSEGFYYAPDEKYVSVQDIIQKKDEWMGIQLSNMPRDIGINELLKKWVSISYEKVPSDFVSLPYVNIKNSKISYIPIKMISKMYMSNGMCAGNTIHEALVQGIAEILERFANKKIIKNKITPPTVPKEYIERFPEVNDMIKNIEARGNYKVIVKDCSLGCGYPVVAVIFINRDNQSYFIKFGSHPVFNIALERSLTELLQGRDLNHMIGIKEFKYMEMNMNEYTNLMSILVDGSGVYPSEFFSSSFSYEFNEFKDVSGYSNKELLEYFLKILESKGYTTFVRDVSYLGFPSYHVIVPGLSEIDRFYDLKSIDDYSRFVKVKKVIRNIENVPEKEIIDTLEYMKELNIFGATSVAQLLNIHTKKEFSWCYSNMNLFIAAAYYKIGDFVNAYNNFDKFLSTMRFNSFNKDIYVYYKCVRDYIGTRIDNLRDEEVIDTLKNFYSIDIINNVIDGFKDNKKIFIHFGKLQCWDCEKCDFSKSCSYKSVEMIYEILKHNYNINRINQMNLGI